MKIKLDDELVKQVVEITGVDYTGLLEWIDIENIIRDLIHSYHWLEEQQNEPEDERDEFKEWRDNNECR